MKSQRQSWARYVAIGDSFTEGIGDPMPEAVGGYRGWADRVAAKLSEEEGERFTYANLAVRGKLIKQIIDQQVEPALKLEPDLITLSGGGNDIIRPGADPDEVAALVEQALVRLRSGGATVLIFTGVDVAFSPVFRRRRGKFAIFNENLRVIADRNGCLIADQWALTAIQDERVWAADRLHLNAYGHAAVAQMVLKTLGVDVKDDLIIPEYVARTWVTARAADLTWARQHLMPWVIRRIRGTSSGDFATPKRPDALPYEHGTSIR